MKKEELLFLIKSGFSIEEIMNLAGQPTAQPQAAGQPTIDERITEMQKEIAELREQAHRQNRITAVIENPKPTKTFEENVEDLLMEVNK